MNWTRYKLLIISGGICLIVSGGLIFWILSTKSKSAEVDNKISTLNNSQASLMAKKPYPSEQNFKQLQAEQSKVVEQRNVLKGLIQKGQLVPVEVSRSRFGDYIRGELVPELRKIAKESTKGGEQGVIVKDPDFGLTEYLNGLLPETSKIPGLLLDLQTMEHLYRMLFDSGISELIAVKKVVEEKTNKDRRGNLGGMSGSDFSGFNSDPMLNQMGGMNPKGPQVEVDGRSKLLKEKDRLFDWEDYRLEFRVYEDYLWATLNEIVSDSNQLVITDLSVTNSNQILWPKYLEPVLGSDRTARTERPVRPAPRREMSEIERFLQEGGGDDVVVEPKEEAVKIAGLADRRQNAVGGDLLNVVMVVRVYRLAEETQETEEGL